MQALEPSCGGRICYVENKRVEEFRRSRSAGSAAGIDACLHLVRKDFGSKVANTVARRLVMPPHRDGGQAQYVAAPIQERPGRTIAKAMEWARLQALEAPSRN